jgi:hypothetical protein
MKLILSVAAKDRLFGKAFRRVRPVFDSLSAEFAKIELSHPIHDAILVGLTDDRGPEHFEEIQNANGYFQVLLGCPRTTNDEELKRAIFDRAKRAVMGCPFATPDKVSFERLLQNWSDANFAS